MSSISMFGAFRAACAAQTGHHNARMVTCDDTSQEIQESVAETTMSTRNLLDNNTVPPGLAANDKGEK